VKPMYVRHPNRAKAKGPDRGGTKLCSMTQPTVVLVHLVTAPASDALLSSLISRFVQWSNVDPLPRGGELALSTPLLAARRARRPGWSWLCNSVTRAMAAWDDSASRYDEARTMANALPSRRVALCDLEFMFVGVLEFRTGWSIERPVRGRLCARVLRLWRRPERQQGGSAFCSLHQGRYNKGLAVLCADCR